jgi:hypothetical protein
MRRQQAAAKAALTLAVPLAAKLAAIVVHADEGTSSRGHHFDIAALRALVASSDVQAWLKALGPLAPEKRR